MTTRLFAYGMLVAPRIVEALLGREPRSEPGGLAGFERLAVRGETYPGVVPDAEGRVDGRLYADLRADEFALLDLFEGAMYERVVLDVLDADASVARAHVYVVRPEHRVRLEGPWQLERFERDHLERAIRDCARFGAAARSAAARPT